MGKVSRIYSRREVENAFLEAFDRSGGVQRLTQWAAEPENYLEFLKLMVKFAPKDEMAEKGALVVNYVSSVPASPLNRPKPDELDEAASEDIADGVFIGMDE